MMVKTIKTKLKAKDDNLIIIMHSEEELIASDEVVCLGNIAYFLNLKGILCKAFYYPNFDEYLTPEALKLIQRTTIL